MLKRMRPRITFSNVVALLALFFALGGTVYAAAKINGKQIKSNSIPGNRVKKNSLTSAQIKDSSLTSVKSASGLASVNYVSASQTLPTGGGNPILVTATCPAGQKAIGGGATSDDPTHNAYVNDMTFTADRSGYVATFFPGGTTQTGTVTAACIPVG